MQQSAEAVEGTGTLDVWASTGTDKTIRRTALNPYRACGRNVVSMNKWLVIKVEMSY